MSRSVLIFNPEHDLALAYGKPNYIPSASVRQMRTDLAVLPMWFADAGDAVLAASAYNDGFVKEMNRDFSLGVQLLVPVELPECGFDVAQPWGWDESVRKELKSAGLCERALCGEGYPDMLRVLSHRSQAVELLPRLRSEKLCGDLEKDVRESEQLSDELEKAADESALLSDDLEMAVSESALHCGESALLCGESELLCTEEECRNFVESRGNCVLKAPLSGSGKGLNWCKGVYTPHIANWCRNILAAQGSVVGEPMFEKVADFAMEFELTDGGCSFIGYSLFNTNRSGAYDANWLASNARIEDRIGEWIPKEVLVWVRGRLLEELSDRFGGRYVGRLGVDMMVCRVEGAYRMHPCVEINLRMNMGVVARVFYDRYCSSESEGEFHIAYYPKPEEALAFHRNQLEAFPPVIREGRICSGYLALCPVQKQTHYLAWVKLNEKI